MNGVLRRKNDDRAICLAGRTPLLRLPIFSHHTPELMNEHRPPLLCPPLSFMPPSFCQTHPVIHESHYDSNMKFRILAKQGY
jgi:hypothetical protein